MAKSIMHRKDGTCFLCQTLRGDDSIKQTYEHHVIYGTGRRRLSEQYGLKVYLCLHHHTEGPEAVHRNTEIDKILKQAAQITFERRYGPEKYMEAFGKSYLD